MTYQEKEQKAMASFEDYKLMLISDEMCDHTPCLEDFYAGFMSADQEKDSRVQELIEFMRDKLRPCLLIVVGTEDNDYVRELDDLIRKNQ
jgi:hypothetical protein